MARDSDRMKFPEIPAIWERDNWIWVSLSFLLARDSFILIRENLYFLKLILGVHDPKLWKANICSPINKSFTKYMKQTGIRKENKMDLVSTIYCHKSQNQTH